MTISATDVARLHTEAIRARLEAVLPGGFGLYVGEVTTDEDEITYPYLVIWPAPAQRHRVTINGYGGGASTTLQITAAGTSVDEVLAALDRASAALHRYQPSIAGRRSTGIRQDESVVAVPVKDDRVKTPAGHPVYTSFIIVTLYSTSTPSGS